MAGHNFNLSMHYQAEERTEAIVETLKNGGSVNIDNIPHMGYLHHMLEQEGIELKFHEFADAETNYQGHLMLHQFMPEYKDHSPKSRSSTSEPIENKITEIDFGGTVLTSSRYGPEMIEAQEQFDKLTKLAVEAEQIEKTGNDTQISAELAEIRAILSDLKGGEEVSYAELSQHVMNLHAQQGARVFMLSDSGFDEQSVRFIIAEQEGQIEYVPAYKQLTPDQQDHFINTTFNENKDWLKEGLITKDQALAEHDQKLQKLKDEGQEHSGMYKVIQTQRKHAEREYDKVKSAIDTFKRLNPHAAEEAIKRIQEQQQQESSRDFSSFNINKDSDIYTADRAVPIQTLAEQAVWDNQNNQLLSAIYGQATNADNMILRGQETDLELQTSLKITQTS